VGGWIGDDDDDDDNNNNVDDNNAYCKSNRGLLSNKDYTIGLY
jgi:hypothetical protein